LLFTSGGKLKSKTEVIESGDCMLADLEHN